MKKLRFYYFAPLLIACLNYHIAPAQVPDFCASDSIQHVLEMEYPSIAVKQAQLDSFTVAYTAAHQNDKTEEVTYTIPVVFHIIHDYGPEDITDAQVLDAMNHINADYSKTNWDTILTIPQFQGIAANCHIKFVLAQRTLSGACTNGIEHIPSMQTYIGDDGSKLNQCQHAFYLNIWVVKTMADGIAAYSTFPASADNPYYIPFDGIICRYDYVGTIGAAGSYAAHVLSHEIGHFFNLYHPWGNDAIGVNCGDDAVGDTPMTKGWNYCNLAGDICVPGVIENVQNIMDYSYCSTMFTEGQKSRMDAALNNPSGMRENLWQESTLELTGTNDGYVAPLCSPTADFYATSRFGCTGANFNFHDMSWGGAEATRSWTFEGGTPSTSVDPDPVVTYADTGRYKIELDVTNDAGTNSKIMDQYIYVSRSLGTENETTYEKFDDAAEVNSNWICFSKYPNTTNFSWRPSNGYYNSGCMWLNSYGSANGDVDAIISPAFNLVDDVATDVFFKYCSTTSASTPDAMSASLKIYYSTDCGATWHYFNQISGSGLVTSFGGSIDMIPTLPTQWASAAFSIPDEARTANVRFKIEYTSDYHSNNVFIDDFNFENGVLNINDPGQDAELSVAPDPVSTNGNLQLNYVLFSPEKTDIIISDISGRQLTELQQGLEAAGAHDITVQLNNLHLGAGFYFITLDAGGEKITQKIIIE